MHVNPNSLRIVTEQSKSFKIQQLPLLSRELGLINVFIDEYKLAFIDACRWNLRKTSCVSECVHWFAHVIKKMALTCKTSCFKGVFIVQHHSEVIQPLPFSQGSRPSYDTTWEQAVGDAPQRDTTFFYKYHVINHKGNWVHFLKVNFGWTMPNLLERDLNLWPPDWRFKILLEICILQISSSRIAFEH